MNRVSRWVAAAGLALTSIAAIQSPVAAAAVQPGYVAIVISGSGTGCVRWFAGITGDDVLNAVASVHYRSDGLIDQINGQPSPAFADATHYWSYWHDTSGSWQYSSTGASGASPPAGSVEGWSFVDGEAKAPPPSQNPAGLYAASCGAKDRATSPAPATRPPAQPKSSGLATRSSVSGGGSSGDDVNRRRASSAGPPGQGGTAPTPARSSAAARSASVSRSAERGSGVASSGTSSGGPTIVDATSVSSSKKTDAGSVLPVVLGLALVVLLGAGAGWTVLRRRRADAADF